MMVSETNKKTNRNGGCDRCRAPGLARPVRLRKATYRGWARLFGSRGFWRLFEARHHTLADRHSASIGSA